MKDLKLKICGMRESENIRAVMELEPDYMGFIFYSGSPRYVGDSFSADSISSEHAGILRVGVFVDESIDSLVALSEKCRLDMVQLHGNESPDYCRIVKERGYGIIKSFLIGDGFKFRNLEAYAELADLFLFDTKGMLYGGSGMSFDWSILEDYPFAVPFLLSGGISLDNIEKVSRIRSPKLLGIDVNSRFEIFPGLKDIDKLKALKEKLEQMKSN